MAEISEAIERLRASGWFHSGWYRRTYPDVAASGLDPIEHYLRYGAALGRNPSRDFDARCYLAETPEAAAPGVNPLLHFLSHGQPAAPKPRNMARRIGQLRQLRHVLGFEARPLAELTALGETGGDPSLRALALRESALWALREASAEGDRRALALLKRARALSPPLKIRREILVAELIALYRRGETEALPALWQTACLAGEFSPDAALARVNFAADAAEKLERINGLLGLWDLAPVGLLPAAPGLSPYDRLCAGAGQAAGGRRGPLVTVLLAAYDAGRTLPTALRALQQQSWADLEILVIDDASPGPETAAVAQGFAARDPRIRLIRMETNGGAYLARNRGLAEARGEFVTLHDADDWVHPDRIAHQVAYLREHPARIACTTKQARATAELEFLQWSGMGRLLSNNISSLTFRRAPVQAELGGWDSLRLSADSELMRRIAARFGPEATTPLDTGPFAFQRSSASSVVADPVLGMDGFLYGARKIYADLQAAHHARAAGRPGGLRYDGDPARRPFAAPALMRPERDRLIAEESALDLILGADLRQPDAALDDSFARIAAARPGRVALFELYRYGEGDAGFATAIHPAIAARIEAEGWRLLSYGEDLRCSALWLQEPELLEEPQRYIPRVTAEAIRVRLGRAAPRALLARAAAHLAQMFQGPVHWHPAEAGLRQALAADCRAAGISLAPEDWPGAA